MLALNGLLLLHGLLAGNVLFCFAVLMLKEFSPVLKRLACAECLAYDTFGGLNSHGLSLGRLHLLPWYLGHCLSVSLTASSQFLKTRFFASLFVAAMLLC